jgi:hypothetical protein
MWNYAFVFRCNPNGVAWPSFYATEADDYDSASAGQVDLTGWCTSGHTGRLCAKCDLNYFSSGRSCGQCMGVVVHALIIFLNGILICTLLAYLYVQQPSAETAERALNFYTTGNGRTINFTEQAQRIGRMVAATSDCMSWV